MSKKTRYIPAYVRRQLRQEAGFGCCLCGSPFVEYHHIIPWSEKRHNDPEHMVAVCPSHHAEVEKQTRSKQYDLKHNPQNVKTGAVKGRLVSAETEPAFILGGCTFVNTPRVFTYFELPVISYEIVNGEKSISLYIPNNDFWPELLISQNQIVANPEAFWDIDFHHNLVTFRKSKGKKFVEIDFRNPVAEMNAEIEIKGEVFRFSPKSTTIGGTTLIDVTMLNGLVGIGHGDPGKRILLPNYALRTPRPKIHNIKSGEIFEMRTR